MRKIRIVLWFALAAVSARLIWIGLDRQMSLHRLDRSARKFYNAPDLGHGLKITQFYARAGEVTAGDRELICYGVRDATRVWIEPPVEDLRPALTRCFFVEPRQDTSYTLLAEDAAGRRVSESFRVRVVPAPPEIRMLAVSARQVRKGEAATICYGVEHARTVRLEPIGWQLAPSKDCVRFYPAATATYRLVAAGEGGRTDRRAFAIAVR